MQSALPAIAGFCSCVCIRFSLRGQSHSGAYFRHMNSGTSQNDSDALKSRGWTLDSIKQQEAQLRSGCQPVEAVSACEVGHGIFILTS